MLYKTNGVGNGCCTHHKLCRTCAVNAKGSEESVVTADHAHVCHCHNLTLATCVPNVYAVSDSSPVSNRKRALGTIKCALRFMWQMEQLQSHTSMSAEGVSTSKVTALQWQWPWRVSKKGSVAQHHTSSQAPMIHVFVLVVVITLCVTKVELSPSFVAAAVAAVVGAAVAMVRSFDVAHTTIKWCDRAQAEKHQLKRRFFFAFVWLAGCDVQYCNHFRNTCALTHRPFSQSPSLPLKSSSTLLFTVQSSAAQLVAWSRVGVVALFVCQTFCSVLDTHKECIPLYTRHNGASHGEPQARPTARRQSRAWCP